jgi:hypothetical protein
MTQTPQTLKKGLKPGDTVLRGAGTARWVVNFVHPTLTQVTLVREGVKARAGSTRWWNEDDLYPVTQP